MIALALFISAQVYEGPKQAFNVIGSGNSSCATAWTAQNSFQSYAWVVGFWSGINSGRGGHVGGNTDANGIVGEVKKQCEAAPSSLLVTATLQTYKRMAEQGM